MRADTTFHNIEAEQGLLGAVMLNNDVFYQVNGIITTDDFYDPVHGRIWANCAGRIAKDHLASPVTLKVDFENDEGLKQLGGPKYLATLAGAAMASAAKSYATQIAAMKRKRLVEQALDEARELLNDPESDATSAASHVEAATQTIEPEGQASTVSFLRATHDAVQGVMDAYNSEGAPGAPTGLQEIDDLTGGFFPGDLVIMGGRPSMGKSALALSMALGCARQGKGVGMVSLEMRAADMALRALSEASARDHKGVIYTDARRGEINEHQARALLETARDQQALPITFIPPHVRDIGAIYATAKRLKRQMDAAGTPLSMLIIDYMQLIRSAKQSRYEQISEISMGLKGLAMQLEVPVVALSQLSRALEQRDSKRPIMSDLRESGQIEQDADLIMFCYREEYYLRQEQPDGQDMDELMEWQQAVTRCAGTMDVIIAKQRMGQLGTVTLDCDLRYSLITDKRAA